MIVGYFDGGTEKCPNDEFVSETAYRMCKAKASGSCASVPLETYGVTYTDICGAVTGYQAGATAAFDSTADILIFKRKFLVGVILPCHVLSSGYIED